MPNKPYPLSNAKKSDEVYITDLARGKSFRSKVSGFGLNIGTKLKINQTTSSRNGCIILTINDSRLAIDQGMAEKILVSSSFVKN